MSKSVTILMISITLFFAPVCAEQIPDDVGEFKASLSRKAGPTGPFAGHENFPKSYFLIPSNLPFMVGLTLHHPMRSRLNLTEQQVNAIKQIKQKQMPEVIRLAGQIKQMEVALADRFIEGAETPEMETSVEKIGELRVQLSKRHVQCIEQVKNILNGEQFKTLLSYAKTH